LRRGCSAPLSRPGGWGQACPHSELVIDDEPRWPRGRGRVGRSISSRTGFFSDLLACRSDAEGSQASDWELAQDLARREMPGHCSNDSTTRTRPLDASYYLLSTCSRP